MPSPARLARAAGLLAWAAASAACAAPPPPWAVTDDGQGVTSPGGTLIWSRCVQGMQWTGRTCAGQPALATRAEAIAWAAARRSTDRLDWRLPRVTELQKLAEPRAHPPGLDARLFPAAPTGWYWSATARVDTAAVNPYHYGNIRQGITPQNANHLGFLQGWAVNLDSGEGRDDVLKSTRLPVRLVRSVP